MRMQKFLIEQTNQQSSIELPIGSSICDIDVTKYETYLKFFLSDNKETETRTFIASYQKNGTLYLHGFGANENRTIYIYEVI